MNFFKKSLIALGVLMCISIRCSATSYEIKDFGIKNIDVPDDYMSCSIDSCDEDLLKLLSGNRYTFEDWKSQIMVPNDFYIYSCNKNKLTECMYLICEKIDSPKSAESGISHKLAEDYNLITDGEKRAQFLQEKEKSGNVEKTAWLDTEGDTSYIEYYTLLGEDYCHCYETIYGGNRITLMFSSKASFNDAAAKNHADTLATLTYAQKADYTEVNKLINDAIQKKLEEETHSGENTKILRIIISISLIVVIAFAILMAVRTQSKKRRKTLVLREPEAAAETDETKEDN